jgi:hypothetical protein
MGLGSIGLGLLARRAGESPAFFRSQPFNASNRHPARGAEADTRC